MTTKKIDLVGKAGSLVRMRPAVLGKRFWFILALKVGIVISAFGLAFLLRFDFDVPEPYWQTFRDLLMALLIIKLTVFYKMGLFQGWWRYVSLADVFDMLKANIVASLGFVLYIVFAHGMAWVPRSVLILDGFFCFLFACGIRIATRAFRENYLPMPRMQRAELTPILIYGAGSAGQLIAREIRQNASLGKKVVGFIDDDPQKLRKRFQGVPVLGGKGELVPICQSERIEEVIIVMPSVLGKTLRDIISRCEGCGVKFKTLPGMGDLIGGRASVQQVRDVDLDDLLGREPVQLDLARLKGYLAGKRILITGAGGSIGSEIARQVATFGPESIILYEVAETPLFQIQNEMEANAEGLAVMAIMGDVRDRAHVEGVFSQYRPEVVFHAAAYKHVPMAEVNPAEVVNNNVRGTRIVADAAHAFQTKRFVLISTDKAVRPTNIMGASKRAAEIYVQSLAQTSRTQFVTVRFGNVLGSNGSVVPIFKEQIRGGGPVTVTHPDITRYFMTIPEAVQLVLQAGSMGEGGEIFLLDMGVPVRIVDLAEELIRLSGFKPYEEVDIVFTGLRPGEKLHEELFLAGEGVKPTSHRKIQVAQSTFSSMAPVKNQLELLYQATRAFDAEQIVFLLQEIVPEYKPHTNMFSAGPRRFS